MIACFSFAPKPYPARFERARAVHTTGSLNKTKVPSGDTREKTAFTAPCPPHRDQSVWIITVCNQVQIHCQYECQKTTGWWMGWRRALHLAEIPVEKLT